jgi:acyl-CoA synthetase (AMP-forming)/AMP-acid ligase II
MATNLTQLLLERAQMRPDLVIGTVDDQVALPEALSIAAGQAEGLRAEGLNDDARLAIVASTATSYFLAWMSCLLARIPVALVNPTYPQDLLGQMVERLGPALVVTDLDDHTFAQQTPVRSLASFRSGDAARAEHSPGFDADPSDIASFMHTSGTTGIPKYCAQTHQYFIRLGQQVSASLELTDADRMLAPLPLFHINPLGYGIIGALSAGADALTVEKFSASKFWPTVKDHGITALALHAPPVEILKRATTAEDASGHAVRTMFYADQEFMSRFGIAKATSGYGSTEAAGVSHLHQWNLGKDEIPTNASRYGGSARSDVEDRIDDDGQIFVRALQPNTLFAGYFANGKTDPTLDENGWFATGDLGRRDDRGGLVFVERAAESIRVKGEFVPIPFVEEQLGTIDELDDLALWKKPGELVDDEVVLYVVAQKVPIDRIRTVAATLPAFMRPSHVAHIEEMPRDAAAGKVQRRLLHGQTVLSWTELH